jgi:hypothetical protein
VHRRQQFLRESTHGGDSLLFDSASLEVQADDSGVELIPNVAQLLDERFAANSADSRLEPQMKMGGSGS